MQATVSKWGNSQALRLPKSLINQLSIHPGDLLNIRLDKRKIILEPAASPSVNLNQLLAQMPDDYQANEVFSDAQGAEFW
ncbi:MAG: AbrB/MazE/SpoVT family DNA-binding domain-containing protein [Candidatus Thioglobus sp.]|nr:AbrB/MazE/SpoVT family DNA-binding domain-containing protein [Candidatus Thioglobus sp.]